MSMWHCPNCGLTAGGPVFTGICGKCNTKMSIASIVTDIPAQDTEAHYVRTSSGTPEEIAAKRAKFEEDRKYRLTPDDYHLISASIGFTMGYLFRGNELEKYEFYRKLFEKIEYQRKRLEGK